MKKLLSTIATLVIAAGVAGFGVASLTVGASASTSQTAGEVGSALQLDRQTQVNHYETPCDLRERLARGIPAYSVHEGRGLMAYVWEHLDENYVPDAELADYWAALDTCDINEPVAKWDFENMVLTHIEFI